MHYKRKKARTKSRSVGVCPHGNASNWNILFHTRPRRRRDVKRLHHIRRGADPDALIWDVSGSRPRKHYW